MNDLLKIAFALYVAEQAEGWDEKILEQDVQEAGFSFTAYVNSLNHPHFGDCTNDAITCLRCNMERLLKEARHISQVTIELERAHEIDI